MALQTSAILKCCLSNNQSTKILQLFRGFHHVRPVIKYNLTKPETDVDRYDPEGTFSPMVREFIKARGFENAGGKMLDVVSLHTGEKKGSVIVNDFVFGTNTRMDILQRNVVWYSACIRAGTACVKRRGEVRGGGRKPWPQKGTGRARQGSIRAPHWRKGGSAKGPKPRDWSYNLPYKVRRLGLRSALSCRLAQGDLTIVEDLKDLPGSSKDVLYLLQSRGLENSLIVDGFENKQLESLVRDMEKVDVSHALFLHVYGILKRRKLVLSLQALRLLEEKLCEDNRIVTVPEYELYHQDMLLDKSLLFHEYDPKSDTLRGNLIPKPPRKTLRSKLAVKKKLPMSRQDLKR